MAQLALGPCPGDKAARQVKRCTVTIKVVLPSDRFIRVGEPIYNEMPCLNCFFTICIYTNLFELNWTLDTPKVIATI